MGTYTTVGEYDIVINQNTDFGILLEFPDDDLTLVNAAYLAVRLNEGSSTFVFQLTGEIDSIAGTIYFEATKTQVNLLNINTKYFYDMIWKDTSEFLTKQLRGCVLFDKTACNI